jgi:hypothetical protein
MEGGLREAADIATAKEADRQTGEPGHFADRKVADRETKNAELCRLVAKFWRRYERFGIGDALAAREPFVGIARVKLENQVRMRTTARPENSRSTGSSPPPGKPEQNPPAEQKAKPQSSKPNDR